MSINLLTHLSKLIHYRANKHWAEYIMGNRDTFMFSEDEMMEMFNKAGELYVSDMLDDLVDKNVLEVSVDESGDLLYGLSEEGKKIINDELPKQGRPKKK